MGACICAWSRAFGALPCAPACETASPADEAAAKADEPCGGKLVPNHGSLLFSRPITPRMRCLGRPAGTPTREREGLDQEGREQQEERRSNRLPADIVGSLRDGPDRDGPRDWHRNRRVEPETRERATGARSHVHGVAPDDLLVPMIPRCMVGFFGRISPDDEIGICGQLTGMPGEEEQNENQHQPARRRENRGNHGHRA